MKDIYSPLEIDEEWDNFSPVDMAAPVAAGTSVPVTAESNINIAQPTAEPMSLDMSQNADPAREEANAEIAKEQSAASTAPAVEDNIAKWTANDGNNGTENTDKLEFGEMGSKLPAERADSIDSNEDTAPVTIDVNPSSADNNASPMTAETDNANDMPKPVEINMGGTDNNEAIDTGIDNTNDIPKPEADELGSGSISPSPVMPTSTAVENTNSQELKSEDASKYEGSALEDTKNMLRSRIEDLNQERQEISTSKEDMMKDKQAKTDSFNQEISDIDQGIKNADDKIAELDKFIAQLEALK